MFKVGITTSKGRIEAHHFNTKDEVDTYLLEMDERETLTHFRIELDGVLIETEKGRC